jgi:hypothetical protein
MRRVVPILVRPLLCHPLLTLPLEAKLIFVTIFPTIATMKGYGLRLRLMLTVKIRQPSHEFTFGVGMTFVSYSLLLTPVV